MRFYELPCDIAGFLPDYEFRSCASNATLELERLGLIDSETADWYCDSMMKGYQAHRVTDDSSTSSSSGWIRALEG